MHLPQHGMNQHNIYFPFGIEYGTRVYTIASLYFIFVYKGLCVFIINLIYKKN